MIIFKVLRTIGEITIASLAIMGFFKIVIPHLERKESHYTKVEKHIYLTIAIILGLLAIIVFASDSIVLRSAFKSRCDPDDQQCIEYESDEYGP